MKYLVILLLLVSCQYTDTIKDINYEGKVLGREIINISDKYIYLTNGDTLFTYGIKSKYKYDGDAILPLIDTLKYPNLKDYYDKKSKGWHTFKDVGRYIIR